MQNSDQHSSQQMSPRSLSVDEYIQAEARLTVEQKTVLATHLAANLGSKGGTVQDAENAEAILRMLIWSDEKSVVESLAQAAASNPDTPRDLAWALANDDEAVAMPILGGCASLSDTDLIAIVESADSGAKLGAIAGRSSVSANLSRSLATHGDENVSRILLNNAKADIPSDALTSMVDRHGQHDFIQDSVVARNELPPEVTAKLRPLLNQERAQKMEAGLRSSGANPIDQALMCHKPARVGYVNDLSADELNELIFQMLEDESLTPQILLRSLCFGNFDFFCRAFSFMAAQPKDQISEQIVASPAAQITKLWAKTSFSDEWLAVVIAAATTLSRLQVSYVASDIDPFRRDILDGTLSLLKKGNADVPASQIDFLRQAHSDAERF